MADTDCVPYKQCLKMSTIHKREFWGAKEERGHYIYWLIKNLESLEINVEYSTIGEKINWIFAIMKKSESYDVTIYTVGYRREIVCSIIYCCGSFSSEIVADIISPGIQKVNLPFDIVNVPENTFLETDNLAIVLKFNKDGEILKPILCPKDLDDTYTYVCIYTIFDSVNNNSHKDFFIHVGDKVFQVHKAILVARSSFFRQFIEENCADEQIGEITIDAPYDAVYAVLSFIYIGHVLINTSDDLVQILALAEKFGINRLKTFIKKHMHNVVTKHAKTLSYSNR